MGPRQAARSLRAGLERSRRRVVPEAALSALLIALTQIVVAGLPAALLVDRHHSPSRIRLLGNAFLLGTGIVALVLLAMSIAGIAWTRVNVTVALLLIAAALWIAAMKVTRAAASPLRTSWIDVATLALLVTHGFLVARQAVGEWDFWAIWGLKGRAFFERGAIDWTFLREPLNAFQHSAYPPLIPLDYAFVAIHGGGWNDRWLGLITTLFAAALVLIARDAFARELPPHIAALATLVVAAIAATPWIGMAEAPMIAYGAAGLLLVRQRALPAGATLLGLSALAKNEGLALIAATAGALLLAGRWREIPRLWPAPLLAAPWVLLRSLHGITSDYQPANLDPTHLGPIVRTLIQSPPERPLLWTGIALAMIVFVRDLRRERLLLAAALLQILFYLGAYFVTPYDVEWQIRHSWPRLLDHVAVPLAFVALLLTGRPKKDDREASGGPCDQPRLRRSQERPTGRPPAGRYDRQRFCAEP